jgi:hypothetical protein
MTSFSTSTTTSSSRLPLILPILLFVLIASNLFFRVLLGYKICCILYNKCSSLTDTCLFSSAAFTKYFICLAKSADFSMY